MRWNVLLLLMACTADDPVPGSGSLRVLSYNVHGLPPAITGDDTAGRLDQIGGLLDGWDAVGLQEDFDDANHQVMVDQTAYPHTERFDAIVDEQRVYGSGLSFLSTLAVDDRHEEHFTQCVGVIDSSSDCLASKGFQMVRLSLADGLTIDVYNSHFEAGGGLDDVAARASQVDQIIAAMQTVSEGRAVLFLGDTNLHGDDPVDQIQVERWFAETGLQDLCDALSCPEPGRIDRIAFRSGAGLQVRAEHWSVADGFFDPGGVPLSDHDPISGVVRWEETAGPSASSDNLEL